MKKLLCLLLAMIASCLPLSLKTYAEEMGTIAINLKAKEIDQTSQNNEGFEMGLIQCASGKGTYTTLPAFTNEKIDYADLNSRYSQEVAAETLYSYLENRKGEMSWNEFLASNDLIYRTGTTNASGIITFSDISEGIYLLFMIDSQDRGTVAPALVFMPTVVDEDGTEVYQVPVYPKLKDTAGSTPDTPDNPSGQDRIPQEGTGGANGGSNGGSNQTTTISDNNPSGSRNVANAVNTGSETDTQNYIWMALGAGCILMVVLLNSKSKNESTDSK